jgi:acyl carrier protein
MMGSEKNEGAFSREAILKDLLAVLEDITLDWDLEFDGSIGPHTRLIADLAFESVDVVQFVVAIEEQFKCRGLSWEEFLMEDGRYVDEIKVGDTVDFLYKKLNNY